MSTQDIPDNELDNFFKKSLEEPRIEFEEEVWVKMEEKLDKAAKQNSFFRRLFYSLLLLLAIATLISWLYIGNKPFSNIANTNSPKQPAVEGTVPEANGVQPSENKVPSLSEIHAQKPGAKDNHSNKTDENEPETNLSEKPIIQDESPITGRKPSVVSGSKEIEERIQSEQNSTNDANKLRRSQVPAAEKKQEIATNPGNPAEKSVTAGNPGIIQNNTKPDVKTDKKITEKQTDNPLVINPAPVDDPAGYAARDRQKKTANAKPPTVGVDDKQSPSKLLSGNGQELNYTVIQPLQALTLRLSENLVWDEMNLQKPLLNIEIADLVALQKDTSDASKLARRRFRPGFAVSVLFSPDLSSVGFSNWTMPGTNAGVSLEYLLADRWSIAAALIYSTKIYKAAGSDYNPPPYFWGGGAYPKWPIEVKGNCKVLDIPVNLRYNIIQGEKHRLFASTGVSSYLMLDEFYRYIYDVDDRYLKKSWHTKNENNHFFAVANFSAGYERQITPRFSLQAEPFLKLPMGGVGFGKIKLLSTGAFFSLRYKLGKQ